MPKRGERHVVVQPADISIKLIALTQGQNAIVDAEDYEELNKINWFAHWNHHVKGFYASRNLSRPGRGLLKMHRIVLGLCFGDKRQGDHINGNTLDNRRCNLRIVNHQQNMWNRKRQHNNSSGYAGVSWHSRDRKWWARYKKDGKSKHIGTFMSKEDAAQAFSLMSYLHYGEFGKHS